MWLQQTEHGGRILPVEFYHEYVLWLQQFTNTKYDKQVEFSTLKTFNSLTTLVAVVVHLAMHNHFSSGIH